MLKNRTNLFGLVLTLAFATAFGGTQVLHGATYSYTVGGNSYQHRQEITVSSTLTNSNLTNYPLLVQITNPLNPVFTNAINGSDIVFTPINSSTPLPREIENFTTGGTPSLNAWVKTDISASADTKLYMYYNGTSVPNTSATWDSNYTLVQHLEENPAGPITDSTSYGNNGTNVGAVSALGKIGNALKFDGNDVVNLGTNASLYPTTLTLEAWAKSDVVNSHNGIFTNKSDANHGVNLQTGTVQDLSSLVGDGSGWTYIGEAYTNDPVVGTWYHLTLVHENGNENRFYVNGVLAGPVQLRGLGYSTFPTVQIGNFYSGGTLNFNGVIDELRLSDTARSADWIRAGFLLGDNAGAFLTFGLEETVKVPEPSSFMLLGVGALGLVCQSRRRRSGRA